MGRRNPEYTGGHWAPLSGGVSAPLHNVTPIYPDDIYGPHAAQYYGHWGDSRRDQEAIRVIQAFRDRPNAMLTVYRAMPPDFEPEINLGDWVTTVKAYAVDHGESRLEGEYQIASRRVHARDLFTDGNSIFEFGYDPQPKVGANPFEQPEPPDELYDPEALAAGIEVEHEHTQDPAIARRIAKDHLDEDSAYYRKLATLGLNPGRITITLKPRKGPGYSFQAGSFAEFRRVGREVFKAAFTAAQKRDPFMVEANGNYVGHASGVTVFSSRAIWDDILRIAAGE